MRVVPKPSTPTFAVHSTSASRRKAHLGKLSDHQVHHELTQNDLTSDSSSREYTSNPDDNFKFAVLLLPHRKHIGCRYVDTELNAFNACIILRDTPAAAPCRRSEYTEFLRRGAMNTLSHPLSKCTIGPKGGLVVFSIWGFPVPPKKLFLSRRTSNWKNRPALFSGAVGILHESKVPVPFLFQFR